MREVKRSETKRMTPLQLLLLTLTTEIHATKEQHKTDFP